MKRAIPAIIVMLLLSALSVAAAMAVDMGSPVYRSAGGLAGSGGNAVSPGYANTGGIIAESPAFGPTATGANFTGNAAYAAAEALRKARDSAGKQTGIPSLLAITTATIPVGSYGVTYTQQLQSTGGIAPLSWSVAGGSLPPGLSLFGTTINGTPIQAGSFSFTLQATDASTPPQAATKALSITINRRLPSGKIALNDTTTAVTVADALRALQIAVGMIQPTANDLAEGDVAPLVNGIPSPNRVINVGDAIVILQKSLGVVNW